jgi:hypothetical protein
MPMTVVLRLMASIGVAVAASPHLRRQILQILLLKKLPIDARLNQSLSGEISRSIPLKPLPS